jgi:hypothetical protein
LIRTTKTPSNSSGSFVCVWSADKEERRALTAALFNLAPDSVRILGAGRQFANESSLSHTTDQPDCRTPAFKFLGLLALSIVFLGSLDCERNHLTSKLPLLPAKMRVPRSSLVFIRGIDHGPQADAVTAVTFQKAGNARASN